jgi:hypothetical protein
MGLWIRTTKKVEKDRREMCDVIDGGRTVSEWNGRVDGPSELG